MKWTLEEETKLFKKYMEYRELFYMKLQISLVQKVLDEENGIKHDVNSTKMRISNILSLDPLFKGVQKPLENVSKQTKTLANTFFA